MMSPPKDQHMDLANLCTDVVGGKPMLGANGRACDLEIEFDDQKKTEVPPQVACPQRAILFERSREPRGLDPILESHAVVQGGPRVVRLVLAATDPVRCGPRRRENGRALVADLHPGRANEPRC